MTIAADTIIRQVRPGSIFDSALPVLSTAVTYNQGDMLTFDATNAVLKPVTGSADGANFLGVAVNTVVSGLMPSPVQGTAVDASQAIEDMSGPIFGVVARLYLKSGDAFTPGAKVYISGIDAQTVTVTATGSAVGMFSGKAVTPSASGTQGDILIAANYGIAANV